MNVLLLSRYGRLGAGSRIRSYQYLPHLEAAGIHVTVSPLMDDDYLRDLYAGRRRRWGNVACRYARRLATLLTSRRYDLLWVEDELLPMLPAWGETLLARAGVPYVVDYDDAVFHGYEERGGPLLRDKIASVMRGARLVTAGNDYLGRYARSAGASRVEILPTVIDLDRYPEPPGKLRDKDRGLAVGWIGSPVTAKYLGVARDALAAVCGGGKGRLVAVGPRALDWGGDVSVELRAWSEATEVGDIAGCDVGIMPLPDAPWERGKCGYKLIQYMACGLPVIASPVGVNREIVRPGVNGFLAETPEEWVVALRALAVDPELRERMGRAGRAKVEAGYCLQVTAPHLASLLRAAADPAAAGRRNRPSPSAPSAR